MSEPDTRPKEEPDKTPHEVTLDIMLTLGRIEGKLDALIITAENVRKAAERRSL